MEYFAIQDTMYGNKFYSTVFCKWSTDFKTTVSIKNPLHKVSVFLFEGHWYVCQNMKLYFLFCTYIFLKTLICYVSMPISGKYQICVSCLWFDEINMYKIFYSQIYLDINILFSQICENYIFKFNT